MGASVNRNQFYNGYHGYLEGLRSALLQDRSSAYAQTKTTWGGGHAFPHSRV